MTLLDKAREKYHMYHLHIKQTGAGSVQKTMDGWKQLMGENLIILERHEEVSKIIPQIVAAKAGLGVGKDSAPSGESETPIIL